MRRKQSGFPRIHHIGLALLYASATAIVALMVIGTVHTRHTLNQRNKVKPLPTNPTVSLEEITVPAPTEFTVAEVEFTVPQTQPVTEENINILLVGKDDDGEIGSRSDTIILCTFNKKRDTITMTSFLRDLYVKIPGYSKNRINAAYSLGGIDLLTETLHENFGVVVDGSVQVDFSRFEELIDLLGGVTIELTAAEAAFINQHFVEKVLTEGTHLLNGEQALLYARNRYDIDGDFSRTNRQRKLLSVLIDTFKSKKLTEMLHLMQEILPMITTDISKSDLTAYAFALFPMLNSATIQTQAIPVDGGYYNEIINGMAVLVPDMEKNIQALNDSLN